MADFFSDLGGMIGDQQKATPYSAIDYSGLLKQSIPLAALGNLQYNQQLALPYAQLQRQVENVYDPNQAALREATTSSILNQLNLGSALPADVQQQVMQNALQGSAASGFGLSPGGRGLVARDLGLTGLDLQRQRQGAAASYSRSAPSLSSLYNPATVVTPGDYLSTEVQMAQDARTRAVEEFQRREGNKIAWMNTGGRIIGTGVGAYFGGAAGAQLGGQIGGSLINNPYRAKTSGGGGMGGMDFSSILGGLGGMGGGGMGESAGVPTR